MRLFESDNIWKRKHRAESRAARADTPAHRVEDAKNKLTGTLLWLFGAALLLTLGLVGILSGLVVPDTVTVGFLVVLAVYIAVSVSPTVKEYQHWKSLRDQL
ncbi:MAG: hypothetical protein RRY65_03765 [Pseudoflavonifractor sp.]